MKELSILVVEDCKEVAGSLENVLIFQKCKVDVAYNFDQAVEKLKKEQYDLVWTDGQLEEDSSYFHGNDIAKLAAEYQPNAKIVGSSGLSKGFDEKLVDYVLPKPVRNKTIKELIEQIR